MRRRSDESGIEKDDNHADSDNLSDIRIVKKRDAMVAPFCTILKVTHVPYKGKEAALLDVGVGMICNRHTFTLWLGLIAPAATPQLRSYDFPTPRVMPSPARAGRSIAPKDRIHRSGRRKEFGDYLAKGIRPNDCFCRRPKSTARRWLFRRASSGPKRLSPVVPKPLGQPGARPAPLSRARCRQLGG
jgi:hypothetical protein